MYDGIGVLRMDSHYFVYNIVSYGIILLLVYMFIDIFLGYFRKEEKTVGKRIFFYSFLFYCLCLLQIRLGGVVLPLPNESDSSRAYSSTGGLFSFFENTYFTMMMMSWSTFGIWNLLLFMPLGFYAATLFQVQQVKKALGFLVFCSIGIEILRSLLGSIGLIMATSSVDSLSLLFIFLQVTGGSLGFYLAKRIGLESGKNVQSSQ